MDSVMSFESEASPRTERMEGQSSAIQWCMPELLPKHKIFLSHSGHQKPFVEQLCVDLENASQFPFFDQNSDSLPKGEKFASLILKAAEQCSLAVIVLSKEFMTSKWPMLELSTFVQSKKTGNPDLILLPLFYKLLPSDLDEEKVKSEWMENWKKLVGRDTRTSVELWRDAVSELRSTNGLRFEEYGRSEVRFREIVVKEICQILPPVMEFDTSNMQGCDRLCKVTSLMFEKEGVDSNKFGCEILGVYGMGGLGKSALCQALCNHFQSKFRGRVCHIELGNDRPKDDPALVKLALRKLTNLREDLVNNIHSKSQGHQLLQSRLKNQPVFLAVDNVEDVESSREEARAYLNAGLANGSKVLITSRSEIILKSILNHSKYCKPIPSLSKEEASKVFLSKAAPSRPLQSLETDEHMIIERCLEQCSFPVGPQSVKQYHPLALRALGVYFHDIDSEDIMSWEEFLNDCDKLQISRESSSMFYILGLSYNTLPTLSKLVFLDLTLFVGHPLHNLECELNWITTEFERRVRDIARLHSLPFSQARFKTKELERRCLIDVANNKISVHDLYREFARWLLKENDELRKLCIYKEDWQLLPLRASGSWSNVQRVRASAVSFAGCLVEKVQWYNLVILDLTACQHLYSLNLQGLSCLLELRLFVCHGLKEIVLCSDTQGTQDSHEKDTVNNMAESTSTSGSMRGTSIQVITLDTLRSLKHIPFLSHCWNLQSLSIIYCNNVALPDLAVCSNLKCLDYRFNAVNVDNLNTEELTFYESVVENRIELMVSRIGAMTNLMDLNFDGYNLPFTVEVDFSCLNQLTSLASLSIPGFGNKELPIHGVVLSKLVALNLGGWMELFQLPDWNLMPNLRRLCISGCGKFHAPDAPTRVESFHSNFYHYTLRKVEYCTNVDCLHKSEVA